MGALWLLCLRVSSAVQYMKCYFDCMLDCVMTLNSKNTGTPYLQQSYKVSESFPFKWINKKWREGFYVTAMATAGTRWAIVVSRGAGFSDQVCLIIATFGFLPVLVIRS